MPEITKREQAEALKELLEQRTAELVRFQARLKDPSCDTLLDDPPTGVVKAVDTVNVLAEGATKATAPCEPVPGKTQVLCLSGTTGTEAADAAAQELGRRLEGRFQRKVQVVECPAPFEDEGSGEGYWFKPWARQTADWPPVPWTRGAQAQMLQNV